MACWISVPLILRIEASGPRGAPSFRLGGEHAQVGDLQRHEFHLDLGDAVAEARSSISGRPSAVSRRAISFRRASSRLERPMPAMPVRSWPSRNLA
jgi:hypothetical protein